MISSCMQEVMDARSEGEISTCRPITYSLIRVDFSQQEYNVFGLALDTENRCWIHDGHTNQIIGFDENLKEKCMFDGVCFNRKLKSDQNVGLRALMLLSMLLGGTSYTGIKERVLLLVLFTKRKKK